MNRLSRLTALALALTAGCGGSSQRDLAPLLPGEGSENTAAPSPGSAAGPVDDPWAGADLIAEPAPRPPGRVQLPKVERFTLKNGLEVMVVENPDLPVVGMQLAVKVGQLDQPRDKMGLASFAADMLVRGTRRQSGKAIAETIEFVGGSLDAGAGSEATFVTCGALSKDLDTCLSLVPEVVARPTFPAAEMATVRDGLMAEVRQRRDSAAALATAHFDNFLWGEEHPRGWPMSSRTLSAIGRADLVAWHARWFKPGNAILAIAGDVDAAALRPQLEKRFRIWRGGSVPERPVADAPALAGLKIRVIDKPDQSQSHIRVGHVGLSRQDPDYLDMLVANYALGGGGFASRLMQVVRSREGKTYGASSRFDSDVRPGAFQATTFTRTAETASTLRLVLAELEKMAKAGPTKKEVADATTAITGNYATRFGSALAIASALLDADLHGFNTEYVETFALRVAEVTPASAQAAAKERLTPSALAVVIVGNAKEVVPQLEAAGFPKPEVLGYLEPIARREREAPPVDPTTAKQARALLARAVTAKGGRARLDKLRSVTFEGSAELSQGGQTQTAEQKRVWARPGRVRIDVTLPAMGVQIALVATESGGWVRQAVGDQAQVVDLPADKVAGQLWRNGEMLLLRYTEPGAVVGLLDDETIEGTAYKVVYLADADGNFPSKLYLHPKTLMLERVAYSDQGVDTVEMFGNYKKVKGLQIAHQRDTLGDQSARFSVERVALDEPVEDALFARPTP